MKSKKIKINGIDTLIYKTNKYTTLHIELYFITEYNLRNILILTLLGNYMFQTNKKYKTRKELLKLKYEMYSFDAYISTNYSKDKAIFSLSFEIVDPKLVKDEYFGRLLKEIHTIIFEANFINGKPDEKIFEKCKISKISDYESLNSDFSYISNSHFLLNAFPDTIISESLLSNEKYSELINSISGEELYNMYRKIIDEGINKIVLFGNFNEEYISEIEKNLKFKKINTEKFRKDLVLANPKKNYVTEKFDNVETSVFVLYTFPKLSKKEKFVLITLTGILNYSGRILHKLFREELSLVYFAYAEAQIRTRSLNIIGNINSKNINSFLEGVDYLFNNVITNKEVVNEALTNFLKHSKVDLITKEEDKWRVLNDIISKEFYDEFTMEELFENAKMITFEDILSLVKKAKKTFTYVAEGGKSDEGI